MFDFIIYDYTSIINVLFFSLPQIYEEFYHTINNADHNKDLKWWSNNHGVNMAMNWPAFIVSIACYIAVVSVSIC